MANCASGKVAGAGHETWLSPLHAESCEGRRQQGHETWLSPLHAESYEEGRKGAGSTVEGSGFSSWREESSFRSSERGAECTTDSTTVKARRSRVWCG
ncbi:hypothetical protein GOP47_0026320 [Adiantum capillus-veneris]|nr:hypothetical protein GOP47_0026320 [Adiantum capillus-veneris]